MREGRVETAIIRIFYSNKNKAFKSLMNEDKMTSSQEISLDHKMQITTAGKIIIDFKSDNFQSFETSLAPSLL